MSFWSAIPPRRLSYAWRPPYDEFKHEQPSRVTIDITPLKDQVRLTVIHDDFDEGSVVLEKIKGGWPAVLSSLIGIPLWRRRCTRDRRGEVQAPDPVRDLYRFDAREGVAGTDRSRFHSASSAGPPRSRRRQAVRL
jgi:hypothetical protein